MHEHAVGMNIADMKAGAFANAKSTGVDGGKAGPVAENTNRHQYPPNFFLTEDDGQFLFVSCPNQREGRPFAIESIGVEEFDAASVRVRARVLAERPYFFTFLR